MHEHNFLAFIKSIFLIQLFIAVLILGLSIDISFNWLRNISQPGIVSCTPSFVYPGISEEMARSMVLKVNAALDGSSDIKCLSRDHLSRQFAENMFVSSINALAYCRNCDIDDYEQGTDGEIQIPAIKLETEQQVPPALEAFSEDYRVVYYCTHSAESYIPDSGTARMDGKRGLVNDVANHMAEILQQKGLRADYINTIHDWPEYNKSYTNSRETVKQVVDTEPEITALFDVHRDSIPGMTKASTIKVNGKSSACILIVVGTDEREEHPNWHKNLQFAQKLYKEGQLMYPGLIKGIRTKAGTYNQEYHDHALLLEMGSDYNSLAEARYAGELFIDVLLEVLEQEVN